MTELVWKLFFLLMPGVLSALFVRYLTTNKQYSPFYFFVYAAILGVSNLLFIELLYSIYNIIRHIFDHSYTIGFGLNLNIWNSIFETKSVYFDKIEILITYVLAIPFALIVGFLIKKKTLLKGLKRLNFTLRIGDDDIWNFYLNMPETIWVFVRDYEAKLTYYGKIRAYSKPEEKREIMLEDVIVYNTETADRLYTLKAIYLQLSDGKFSIDLPSVPVPTTFILSKESANLASSVYLVGDFNNWNQTATPMKKENDGSFSVTIDLFSNNEYQYRYLLDGLIWTNDNNAIKFVPSFYGDSVNSVKIL